MSSPVIHNPIGQWVGEHPAVVRVSKAGWLAKGIVYVLAGLLALVVAARSKGWSSASNDAKEASPTGAIKEIAHHRGGPVLLYALAAGMVLYALWRLVSAFLPGSTDAKGWVTRIGYVVSAVIYITLGITAFGLARTPAKPTDGNQTVSNTTDKLMDHSFGRWAIGIAGVIVIGAGIYRIVTGLKRDMNKELDLSALSPDRRRWTQRLGAAGEIGRGVGIGLIGFFLVRAAVTYNPDEATGLDGALRRMAVSSWGVAVVILVGLGFVAYGLFCALTFTARRLESP